MTTMLETMRKKLKEREPSFERDNAVYPFWNLSYGQSATVRFLPYNDPFTCAFWAERILIPMTFSDPQDSNKVWKFRAPCREMYDRSEKCPVLAPVRALYAEEKDLRNTGQTQDADKLKRIAGAHWKKPTYYYQGFVIKSGINEDDTPENLIRVFPINKMLHKKIAESIFSNEEDPFDKLPTGEFTVDDVKALLDDENVDMDKFEGHNFIIKKMQRGDYADWTTGSNWASKLTVLDDEYIAAIAEYGFHDLTKRLPDRPSDEQYEVLAEMMQVSIDRMLHGENGAWQKEWEEAGFKPEKPRSSNNEGDNETSDSGSSSASSTKKKSASDALERIKKARGKKVEAEQVEAEDETETNTQSENEDSTPAATKVQDLAARIRNRTKSA